MGTIRQSLRSLNQNSRQAAVSTRRRRERLLLGALCLAWLPGPGQAQLSSVPLAGPAANLSSVVYFDPPNEQQIQYRVTGAEMTPLPGTLFDVKKLMIQQYSRDGKLEAVAEAPQCDYAQLDNVASSAGPLNLSLDGGRIRVQGEGFLWRQNEQSLIISNQVRTVIKMGAWKVTTL